MARYIDADKLLKEYQETLCFNVLCSLCPFLDNIKDDTCQVEKWINEQPTADVQPVARGEWIDEEYDIGECYATCSVCGEISQGKAEDNGFGYDYSFSKFCPNCGARMEEIE